jgi:thymidine phosphorylase
MKDLAQARKLAATLVGIGKGAGKKVRALLTDMNAPIGYAVGNALEIKEAVDVMKGEGPADTTLLTVEQGAEMLVLAERAKDLDEGRRLMNEVLLNGAALSVFRAIVEAQGGDPKMVDDPSLLPTAAERMLIPAVKDGYVSAIDPMAVAMAALEVGAGRRTKEDTVDPSTGVLLLAKPGDEVEIGDPLAELHHNGEGLDEALGRLASAFEITKHSPSPRPLIIERM